MISLRSKLFAVATPFAIASASLAGVSTVVDGGQDAYLIRLAMWIIAFGILVLLVTWDIHRGTETRQELAFMKQEAAAQRRRADAAEERADELEARLTAVEKKINCRDLAKRLLAGDDVDLLRTYLQEDRN